MNTNTLMSEIVYDPEVDLSQYGVPGMKWGVRRKRGSSSSSSPPSEDYMKTAVSRLKPASSLSNKELQDLITRVDLERRYSQIAPQTASSTRGGRIAKKSAKFLTDLVADVGREQVRRVAKAQAAITVEEMLRKNGKKDLAERISPKKKNKGN